MINFLTLARIFSPQMRYPQPTFLTDREKTIFDLFVTKNIVPNFCGKKSPAFAVFALMQHTVRSCYKQNGHAGKFSSRIR
jgi:hypothetical protein